MLRFLHFGRFVVECAIEQYRFLIVSSLSKKLIYIYSASRDFLYMPAIKVQVSCASALMLFAAELVVH